MKRSGGGSARVPVPPRPAAARGDRARLAAVETFRVAGRAAGSSAVYRSLGAKVGHRKVTRTLEAGFAGAALVLLALGGALSLRWFGRLI